ncbi:putative 3'-5' exonuclease PWA37_003966 [Arxiozyma heterogenica]|uniref:putative 3'-5' exonuclease n=1 Tax=Arxiozyma heterogenica TaxID=278026 RepID=UPI002F1F318E
MTLSSNWKILQKEKKVKVSKKSKKVKTANYTDKRTSNGPQPTKIMSIIYTMNKAIEQHEKDKKEGKSFQFNSTKDDNKDNQLENVVEKNASSVNNKKATDIGKYVAMDCEFVGVGPEGKEHALARISITNYYGHIILDEFVRPKEKVVDWRTHISGIKPEHMKQAISFKDAQKKCAEIIKGRILIGHALKHDLDALLLSHPKSMIRDTARHLPFRKKYAKGKSPSLKKLTKEVLKVQIQSGEHSSVEDARATMLLYKSDKSEFEKLHRTAFGSGKM